MGTSSVLERHAVEDTLFGDPQVVTIEADFEPDSDCFCICGCLTREARSGNSTLVAVDNSMVGS